MYQIAIIDAVRTPIGKMGGTLKNIPAEALGQTVVQALLSRTGIAPNRIDEVIFGHCRQSSDNPDIARLIALRCGIPENIPAYTVMRHCASGMTAIYNGAMSISLGENRIVVAGGTESMSTAPFYIRNARYGLGTGNVELLDAVVEAQFQSQPQEIYGRFNMGETAERVAEKMGVSRKDQDLFALKSQEKAQAAIKNGYFRQEIAEVLVPQKKGPALYFSQDEFPKETTLSALAELKPVFRKDGTVTAGNSSGRNDGASAVLLISLDEANNLGMKPLAIIRSHAVVGVEPGLMGLGPIEASKKALARAGMSMNDIDLVELNEAFAAQSVACQRVLNIPDEKLNVNGGAIALGHPIGSSGCRIIVTLAHALRQRRLRYGLATLCAAGGMGEAMIIEAVQ